jgi:alpha-beta hydrolase superfamily lysophospholipase
MGKRQAPWRCSLVGALLLLLGLAAAPLGAASATDPLPRHAVIGAGVGTAAGGVAITLVVPGTAAERAGLKLGDVVTAIGGSPTPDPSAFIAVTRRLPPGVRAPFAVRRAGAAITVAVTPARAQDEHDPRVATAYRAVQVDGSWRRILVTSPIGSQGRRPAVLIIGGIGCYSIDAPTDAANDYRQIAYDLGRRGFVALRLEKSGVGDSQGPPCLTVDLQSESRSYAAALEALRREPGVDPARIYLLGHSIGSLIAPRLALATPVAGLIVTEAVGRNWTEYELWNLRRQLELSGRPADQVDAGMADKEVCMHQLLVERRPAADIERERPACKDYDSYPAPAAYMQQAAAMNVAEPWTRLDIPLLAIYGGGDYVTAEADHRRIVGIVNRRHPGSAELTVIPGMDHELEAAGDPPAVYALHRRNGSAPYDTRFGAAVTGWLCRREACLPG